MSLYVVRFRGSEMTFTEGEKDTALGLAAKYGVVAVLHRYYKTYKPGSQVVPSVVAASRKRMKRAA